MKHRIAVAGCGSMAGAWLDDAAQRGNAEIVALVDLYEESAKAMAERRGLQVPVFTDISEAIKRTEANLVFDVTVPASHKSITTAALRLGCHVFGEKPMAESMADAEEVVRTAEAAGKRYSVMQNRRYLKHIRPIRDFLARGGIGTVGTVHSDFFIGAHFGGFRDAMENPLIVDMAIHTFDQARFLTGADPVSVYCHEFNPPGSWYAGNASAVCIFEMSDGSVYTYRGSWCSEGFNTSWEADWRIIGDKGTVRWDGTGPASAEVVDESRQGGFSRPVKPVALTEPWLGREGHRGCLDEMFAALEEGRPAETDCKDNIKSAAMVFGAVESARTGRKIRLA
ncbi:gfo/Idh/MocA family oxidoreductase [Cohnella sp. CFH 77786]|uniref:Gfo/Idh/MocA family protein n=1 Tax=Cohnella sp. CFH 77786 TaxID=2662265 RepID=UPI001C60B083|nr:Gfo/Idh/MocA family oxidoreductase [Cohnella sp. CFH 77786]MBW5444626.1 gfo/Idh/MocA family oxidoreductase [Cohnella sp. CFH 77786]